MAVFAPMPRASVITAMAVKPGFLASMRRPYRTSWIKVPMAVSPQIPTSHNCRTDEKHLMTSDRQAFGPMCPVVRPWRQGGISLYAFSTSFATQAKAKSLFKLG